MSLIYLFHIFTSTLGLIITIEQQHRSSGIPVIENYGITCQTRKFPSADCFCSFPLLVFVPDNLAVVVFVIYMKFLNILNIVSLFACQVDSMGLCISVWPHCSTY